MPIPMSLNQRWPVLDPRVGLPEPLSRATPRSSPDLVPAVAGIVAIAAERARVSGDLPALREAVERALDAALPAPTDPREADCVALPRITDADPSEEPARLRRLLDRQSW